MTGWIRPGSSHPSEQTAVQSVRRAAEAPLERLVEHLAQRRVRVHHHRQVLRTILPSEPREKESAMQAPGRAWWAARHGHARWAARGAP
eukprot:1964618-Prymnesium_polylepis.1